MKGKASQNRKLVIGLLPVALLATCAGAADIDGITYGRNADGSYEVQISGSDLHSVSDYSLNNPARIVVDIPNARSLLAESITQVSNPVISNVAVIEGDDRVRATINLSKSMPYKVIETANKISVVIKDGNFASTAKKKKTAKSGGGIAGLDFKRGAEGQGKVQIRLPGDGVSVDVNREGSKIVAKLRGGKFGQSRKLNVGDFGTPVKSVDVFRNQLSISTNTDDFEIVSYQSDNIFSIEVSKPLKEENNANLLPGDSDKKYDGEPLSLNFQDIEVRAVLQLIGDFTDTNIVVSDEVQGSITLRLNNVPWDQALDIILQTKGLSSQENGDVIYVAPSAVIAENKKAAYSVANIEEELAPLQQQLIQVQYARAENLEKIIEEDAKSGNSKDVVVNGLLSSRGSVSVDTRTNTLVVYDVPSSIDKIRRLVAKLDVPVSQVLVDARLVSASTNFAHELGVRWGGAFVGATEDLTFAGSGNATGTSTILNSANSNISSTGQAFPVSTPSLGNRIGVDLASSTSYGSLGLGILGSDFMLDLELSAMQDEGRGEVISSPRVITQDGSEAEITQGQEVAFNKADESGNTTTEWKTVELVLTVTPKIAPNNMVDMILTVTKDTLSSVEYNGEQGIDTSEVKTQVLVDNGETVVLGGVFQQTKTKSEDKVPLLGDLPIVGRAFRRDTNSVYKSELLIFVTPKIIDKRFVSRDKFSELRN